jgi:hypothetical protein
MTSGGRFLQGIYQLIAASSSRPDCARWRAILVNSQFTAADSRADSPPATSQPPVGRVANPDEGNT